MGTYADISAELLSSLGSRSDVSTRIPRWIDAAYFELLIGPRAGFYQLDKADETITTVSGTKEYTLPTDVWWLRTIEDITNDFVLRKKTIDEIDLSTTSTGKPLRWARFGGQALIDPTPDGAYNFRLRYRKRPEKLSVAGTSIVGDEWDEVIWTLARKKAYEAMGEHTKAREQTQLFEAMIALRETTEDLEETNTEASITPRLEDY